MKHVFMVKLCKASQYYSLQASSRVAYEVVAANAIAAIRKAIAQAKGETGHHANWLVERVKHRGPAN